MDVSPAVALALQSLAIDRGTVRVVAALTTAGIPSVLLKGPTTALWLYGDEPWTRSYADTDLLVPAAQVDAAVTALAPLGLVPLLGGASPHEQDGHSVVVRTEARDLAEVDLHHTLPAVRLPAARVWDVLSAHTEPFELLGSPVTQLDPVGRAVVTVLHAARNGLGDPKSTEDLRRLLAQNVDWPAVRQLCGELDVLPALARGLSLLPDGAPVSDQLGVTGLTSVEMRLREAGAPATAYGLAALLETPGWSARARRVARELWPTEAFLAVWAERSGLAHLPALQQRRRRVTYLLHESAPALRAWWSARR